MWHRVEPGLCSLGSPDSESPVFVTANYTLSFDALRSSLDGIDCFILVLNTYGVNVWCAAGKGTFGTDELIERVDSTDLKNVVKHRILILPQLGAPGIDANEVEKRTGFEVEYGPVRASDLPEYMKLHEATPEMRRVRFNLADRLVLIPIELVGYLPILLVLSLIFTLISSYESLLIVWTIMLSGTVLFPILLPHIPTRDFSSKGLILGGLVSLPFMVYQLTKVAETDIVAPIILSISRILLIAPWVTYLSLNFTGSTTFTSRTGVRREIFRYIPIIAVMFILGILLIVIAGIAENMGWI